MATALGSQLRALAAAQGRDSSAFTGPRTRPSILFDPKEAADIDLQTIFSLARAGLEELAHLDDLFTAYRKTLFSPQSTQTDRELETKEFNNNLNVSISAFLHRLSGFILLPASHQVLEYLIRRYKIHVYNVEDIMISILPYHETSVFVRIVQLLKLEKTRWAFLSGVKETGAAPPREVLVQRCTHDMALLEAVCDCGLVATKSSLKSRTPVTFSSVVIIETLATISAVTKDVVNKILPFVLHAFDNEVLDEFRVGGLMIVGMMASRATLSKSLLSTILESMAKMFQNEATLEGAPLVRLSLMVVIEITQTQESDCFPPKFIKSLVKIRELPVLLSELSNDLNVDKFFALFLKTLAEHCVLHKNYEIIVLEAIGALPLEKHVKVLVSSLLKVGLDAKSNPDEQASSATKETVRRVLVAVEKRFPAELDKCISSLFEEQNKTRDESIDLLVDVLQTSLRRPMKESCSSLYLSVDHPEVDVRKAGVLRISELAQKPLDDETKNFVREALLRRLGDVDLAVVKTVLSVDGIEKLIPYGRLLKALGSLVHRCMEVLETGLKSLKAHAKQVAKICLKLLASAFSEQDHSSVQEIERVLLCYLLVEPKTWKLNMMFLKVATQFPVPLFKSLPKDFADAPETEMTKDEARIWRSKCNEKIVGALTTAVLQNVSSLDLLLKAAETNDNAKFLSVLVIFRCFLKETPAPDGKLHQLAQQCLPFLREEWTSISGDIDSSLSALLEVDYTFEHNELELYQKLEKNQMEVYAELILRSLYKTMPYLLPSKNDSLQNSEIVNELFVHFAGSPVWEVFKAHITLLLERLSSDAVPFLSKFYISEVSGVPATIQVHSLNILASCFTDYLIPKMEKQLQLSLPCVFVALASSLKAVRRSAVDCIKAMIKMLKKDSAKKLLLTGSEVLPPELLQKFLQAIADCDENFINDGKFLTSFCSTFLHEDESKERRFTVDSSRSIVTFLLAQALKLPFPAQRVVIEVFHDVGYVREKASVTQSVLFQLLQRRRLYHLTAASSQLGLIQSELDLAEMLLEINIENLTLMPIVGKGLDKGEGEGYSLWALLEALDVDGGSLSDAAVVKPCLSGLRFLSSELYSGLDSRSKDMVFEALVTLAAVSDDTIRASARKALDLLNVDAVTVSKHIDFLIEDRLPDSPRKKKRVKLSDNEHKAGGRKWPVQDKILSVSIALLEFLSRKTSKHAWMELLEHLFHLLRAHLNGKWPRSPTEISQGDSQYLGQLVLAVLENTIQSLPEDPSLLDVDLLVQYVKRTTDAVTRNSALAVITAVGKLYPERVLMHVLDIVSVVGASTVTEDDNHSHTVVQEMLAAVVPFWLKEMNDPETLLQIFVETLPRIPIHRQIDLIKCVLRVANEEISIPAFLLLLVRHSVTLSTSTDERLQIEMSQAENWPISFAEQLCMSYAPLTRVLALVKLSNEFQLEQSDLQSNDRKFLSTWQAGTRFVALQLQKLDVQLLENDVAIQDACRSLLEHVLKQLQVLSDKNVNIAHKSRTRCLEAAHLLLDSVTKSMTPSIFCKSVVSLMKHSDNVIRRKVLQMYVSKLKLPDVLAVSKKKKNVDNFSCASDPNAHMEIVVQIIELLKHSEQGMTSRTKQAAVSALEVFAQRFADTSSSMFASCLPALVGNLEAANRTLVVACIRCTASILSRVGPEALPSLPAVMSGLLKIAQESTGMELSDDEADLQSALLLALEAAVEKLAAFLSPYIEDVVGLVILHPQYSNPSGNANICARVSSLRSLISQKIPARLLLDPLINVYKKALERGEAPTTFIFQMLAVMSSKLDRPSVAAYHTRIFGFCMEAFDLRRKQPKSFTAVEESAITAVVSLVMKLSETTFKPLFVAVHDWAESTTLDGEVVGQSTERSIVFYKLVNQLADKLRSVFVPYFRYLLDGCVSRLTKGEGTRTLKPKKKKAKHVSAELAENGVSPLSRWHLQQLVVSALHKCFMYDTIGFLDGPKFQQLLQPLANQLVEEVPSEVNSLAAETDVPTIKEADEALVSCLGRMALTAGSDLLWKPLNHEVLMHTRNDSERAKRLALDVVKFLAENLREEYLVLIPETIPFLSELLEDQDMTIVAKTQEVIKMLEELSGESLAQYM